MANTWRSAAVLNARAGVIGDPGGVDTEFDHGALLAAEAGWTRRGKLALGVWRYTHDQDDILDVDAAGDPVPRTAAGAYLLETVPTVLHILARHAADPEEAARHFIDLDRYGDHPFDSLPPRWNDAVKKYGEDVRSSDFPSLDESY